MQDLIERAHGRDRRGDRARPTAPTATLDYQRNYPVTVNDPDRAAFAARVAAEVVGAGRVDADAPPVMGAEDFSFMLNARPGAFIFVGNGDTAKLHHPKYDFNDELIPVGCSYWVTAGRDRDAGGLTCAAQPPSSSRGAIVHITTAMTASSKRHDAGRANTGRSHAAPYPSAKKNRNDPSMAPAAKDPRASGNCVETAPSRTTCSIEIDMRVQPGDRKAEPSPPPTGWPPRPARRPAPRARTVAA